MGVWQVNLMTLSRFATVGHDTFLSATLGYRLQVYISKVVAAVSTREFLKCKTSSQSRVGLLARRQDSRF